MVELDFNLVLAMFIGFISTLIQSLTGFGLAIVATPLFLMVYDVKQVVILLKLICAVINVVFLFTLFKHVDWKFLRILFFASLASQPLGLLIFQIAPNNLLKIFLSVVILLFLLLISIKPITIKETNFKTALAGFLSGILTIATSMGGPPLILYLANTQRDKVSLRATCIAFFAFTNISSLIVFLWGGVDLSFALSQMIYLLPACFVGLWVGNKLFFHLSKQMFKRIMFMMLLISALYTLYSALIN